MSHLYQIKYEKNGPLKYISHLDLSSVVSRTFRRAQIEVELTQGFNPRFKISFGPALPLGVVGLEELFNISLIDNLDIGDIKSRVNKFVPEGLKIKTVILLNEDEDTFSQSLKYAVYIIKLRLERNFDKFTEREIIKRFKNVIREFLNRESILANKKTKKGFVDINLRPYIEEFKFVSFKDTNIIISLTVDIQYKGSINPNIIVKEFLKEFKEEYLTINEIIRDKFIINKNCNIN